MTTATPVGVLLAALLLIAGCSGDDDSADGPAPTATGSWQPTPGLCRVLTESEPAELLALDDEGRLLGPQRMQGNGCLWIDRRHPEVQLVLVSMPARDWFRDLPGAIEEQLQIPGLPADQREELESLRAEIESPETDESDQFCDLFSRLAELQGFPEGSTTTVYVTRGGPGLSAQSCADDTFTSLVGRSGRIGGSAPMLAAYRAAIEKLAAARP